VNVQLHEYRPESRVDAEGCMVCGRTDDLTAIVSFEEDDEVVCGGACFLPTRFHALCAEHHRSLARGLVEYCG
jgi:hypothetical protein